FQRLQVKRHRIVVRQDGLDIQGWMVHFDLLHRGPAVSCGRAGCGLMSGAARIGAIPSGSDHRYSTRCGLEELRGSLWGFRGG
ncbi:hypothetical protein ACFL1S_04075, partial [Pseudomonadota bacterium]